MGWNEVTNDSNTSGARVDFVSFKEGVNTIIRVIDEEPFSRWAHWLPQYKRSLTCPGRGCPVCEVIQAAKANKEKARFNSGKRHAIRVINRNADNQVQILEQGKTFFGQLYDLHTEVGDIRGYDIKVVRKGSDTDTAYTLIPLAAKELSEDDQKAIAESSIDFAEYFKAPTNEQLVKIIEGVPLEQIFGSDGE